MDERHTLQYSALGVARSRRLFGSRALVKETESESEKVGYPDQMIGSVTNLVRIRIADEDEAARARCLEHG